MGLHHQSFSHRAAVSQQTRCNLLFILRPLFALFGSTVKENRRVDGEKKKKRHLGTCPWRFSHKAICFTQSGQNRVFLSRGSLCFPYISTVSVEWFEASAVSMVINAQINI